MIDLHLSYNPRDWYWFKPGSAYSSRRMIEVPLDDAEYLEWLATGGVPTRYPATDDELREVLAAFGLSLTQAEADAQAQAVADKATLKAGYLAVLADIDTIEAEADEEIANMTAIINAMPNPAPGIQTAVKQPRFRKYDFCIKESEPCSRN